MLRQLSHILEFSFRPFRISFLSSYYFISIFMLSQTSYYELHFKFPFCSNTKKTLRIMQRNSFQKFMCKGNSLKKFSAKTFKVQQNSLNKITVDRKNLLASRSFFYILYDLWGTYSTWQALLGNPGQMVYRERFSYCCFKINIWNRKIYYIKEMI